MTGNPLNISHIDHVVIRANNMERMIRFYHEVLGCPVEKRQDDIGLVQLRAGGSLIDLLDVNSPLNEQFENERGVNMDHFCLLLASWDGDAILQWLKRHDVKAGEIADRFGATGTGPSIYIHDPEGNMVELKGDT